MDQFMGLVDWVLQMVLYVGIPVSVTFTLIYKFFETLKIDSGSIHGGGGGGGNGRSSGGGGGGGSVGEFFKDVIKIFVVAVIGWVAIFLIRQVVPAAGESVVGGLGF